MVLGQEHRAVAARAAGFLAAGQRHLDGVLGLIALLLETDHRIGPDRRLRLVVRGAAAIEIAAFLDQGEGIAAPILALGLDHVEMGQQQNRLGLGVGTLQLDDDAAGLGLLGRRHEEVDVGILVAAGLETRLELMGGLGAVADRGGGVGFHQLLVEIAETLFAGRLIGHRRAGQRQTGHRR